MAFSSNSSKLKAKATVNKLFESMLPGSTALPSSKGKKSATETFHREVSKVKLSKDAVRKANKAEKAKKNKAINRSLEKEKRFTKLLKHNVIKAHKDSNNLTEAEQKYLNKLIRKNSSAVRRAAEVDDPAVKEEIDELRNEILAMTSEKYNQSRARHDEAKLQSFTEKVKSGTLSYPGLTPGLAPVGYDDDSDDE